MNGLLMSNGYSPVSIAAKKQLEYNEKMVRFYDTGKTEEMEQFLADSTLLKKERSLENNQVVPETTLYFER